MSLESLYEEMYQLTHDHCGCEDRPFRCCSRDYCELAQKFAREFYGLELGGTGHIIPFMGVEGCIVPPHLRPACTIHACCVTYADVSGWSEEPERTARYFVLRQQIIELARLESKLPEYLY